MLSYGKMITLFSHCLKSSMWWILLLLLSGTWKKLERYWARCFRTPHHMYKISICNTSLRRNIVEWPWEAPDDQIWYDSSQTRPYKNIHCQCQINIMGTSQHVPSLPFLFNLIGAPSTTIPCLEFAVRERRKET
jgi:hypothetical protein